VYELLAIFRATFPKLPEPRTPPVLMGPLLKRLAREVDADAFAP
jgi:hypothetical protein